MKKKTHSQTTIEANNREMERCEWFKLSALNQLAEIVT